jgi:hypothetical protein
VYVAQRDHETVEFKALTSRPTFSAPGRSGGSRARVVGAFVPGLTRKSFEKYGFSTATLLTDWAVIVGNDLAEFTLPERLKWPRNVPAYDEVDASAKGRPGATLVLRVDGPRAIDVQYQTPQIIERINAHFGYRAVAEIRFIQAPLPRRPFAASGAGSQPATPHEVLGAQASSSVVTSSAVDPALAAALARLEANISRDRKGVRRG